MICAKAGDIIKQRAVKKLKKGSQNGPPVYQRNALKGEPNG
jgi:hypothetical protein